MPLRLLVVGARDPHLEHAVLERGLDRRSVDRPGKLEPASEPPGRPFKPLGIPFENNYSCAADYWRYEVEREPASSKRERLFV